MPEQHGSNARIDDLSALQAEGLFLGLADRLPGVAYACAQRDGVPVFLRAAVGERARESPRPRGDSQGDVGGRTVLVAEDEDAVRRVVCRVLESGGYEVLAAPSGDEALAKLTQLGRPVDLLLTDVVMPGIPGRELARRASEIQPGLRVLYCSGYTDDIALLRDLRDERVDFLEKPFNGPKLLAKVREVLESEPAN